jgi:DNA-binding CsgD family transcriptional regulator
MNSRNGPGPVSSPRQRLTPREYQVAELVGYGLPDEEIARVIGVSVDMVARHLCSAYAKLGVNSRSSLASVVTIEQGRMQAYKGWEGSGTRAAEPAVPSERASHVLAAMPKPDPLTARTLSELEDRLRSLWVWAGCPSSRQLAAHSGGAFSHATVNKLIHEKPKRPPLRLDYLLGFARACGVSQAEQRSWATAWCAVTRNPGNATKPANTRETPATPR